MKQISYIKFLLSSHVSVEVYEITISVIETSTHFHSSSRYFQRSNYT